MNSPVAHKPIEALDSSYEDGGLHYVNDIRDLYADTDTLFVVTVISDAMRRGVKHFRLDGTPLWRLNDIVDALAEDGEVVMDMDDCEEDPRH